MVSVSIFLKDKNNIIIKPNKSNNNIFNNEKEIDLFFENIVNNNYNSFHPSLLQNHLYNNIKETDFENIRTMFFNKIVFHCSQLLKSKRNNFRKLNRRNNLKLSSLLSFFNDYYIIVQKIDTIISFLQLKKNKKVNFNTKLKWGTSTIIIKLYKLLNDTLISDNFINFILKKSILDEDFTNLKQLTFNMKILNNYCNYENSDSLNLTYINYIKIINNIILEILPKIENNISMDEKIFKIYKFSNTYNHFINYNKKLKQVYLTLTVDNYKLNILDNIINEIKSDLADIFKFNSLYGLIKFIQCYKNELIILTNFDKHLKQMFLLISIINNKNKMNEQMKESLEYYSLIFDIFKFDNCYINEIYNNVFFDKLSDDKNLKIFSNQINKNIINKELNRNSFIYNLLSNIKQKDLLLSLCEYNLIKRLLYKNTNLDYEIKNYKLMNICFDKKYTFNYNTILSDYMSSCSSDVKFKNLITTQDIWKIDFKKGFMKNPKCYGKFTEYLKSFHSDYNYKNKNKFLINYPHIGKVDIDFKSKKQTTNIVMLPIQMFFLELFTPVQVQTEDFLLESLYNNLKEYSKEFINYTIESVLISKIVNKLGSKYVLNMDYTGPKEVNLVKIFNEISSSEIQIERKIIKEIAHERETILSCLVNNILKKTDKNRLPKETIQDIVSKENLLFSITTELFEKTISQMVKKDYIKEIKENDKIEYEKIIYTQ